MKLRVMIWGVVGGLWLVLILNYPLHEYLVQDTPADRAALSLSLLLAGLLSIVGIGAAGSRLSGAKTRSAGVVAGAVSGATSTLIVEVILGVIAAGVWGALPVLEQSLLGAVPECELAPILYEGIISTFLWVYGSIALALVAGLGLGALGGLAGGRAGSEGEEDLRPPMLLAVGGVLASGIATVAFAVVLLKSLFDALSQVLAGVDGCGPVASLHSLKLVAWPLLSCMLVLIAFQLLALWCLRNVSPGGYVSKRLATRSGLISGVTPLLVLVVLVLVFRTMLVSMAVLGYAAAAGLSLVLLRQTWRMRGQPEWATRPEIDRGLPRTIVRGMALSAVILSAMVSVAWLIAGAWAFVVVLTLVNSIEPLALGTLHFLGNSSAEMMDLVFRTNFRFLRIVSGVGVLLLLLTTLVLLAVLAVRGAVKRRSASGSANSP